MKHIEYPKLLDYIYPGDLLYYEGDGLFTYIGKTIPEPEVKLSFIDKVKQCINIFVKK